MAGNGELASLPFLLSCLSLSNLVRVRVAESVAGVLSDLHGGVAVVGCCSVLTQHSRLPGSRSGAVEIVWFGLDEHGKVEVEHLAMMERVFSLPSTLHPRCCEGCSHRNRKRTRRWHAS